jgi:tetratricopeptide (TPR) repeat protein
VDVAHRDHVAAVRDVGREQREGGVPVCGVDLPPEGVTAVQAGRGRLSAAQRAVEAQPGRERRCALGGGVLVVKQEQRHGTQPGDLRPAGHQGPPRNRDPESPSFDPHGGAGRVYAGPTVALRPEDPVGRGPELERLGAVLDDLDGGAPTCVVVEGEPGIGKTWLLSELRRRAEGRGHLVLAGSAAEFERDLPFGLWVDALDAYVASQDLPARKDVDQAWLADLAGVLPSLRRDGAATAPGLRDERHRAHRALRALLDVIADDKPLVLVLDDLHWSDAASIEVLAALLRRGTGERVLLALGYRSGKAPAKLGSALAAPAITIIELGPLSEPECSQLAGEHLPAEQLTAIYTQSGGNPFYTLQLAHASALPSRSSTGDRLALDAGVPRVVAAALVDELEALTAEARMLLRAGAIAGDPFEPELAYAIAELSPESGISALDELLDERLVHATDVPRRFAFRHPLVRRAVYASSKGGWRLAAHARAAQALAAQRASAAARAHHVEQSGVKGEQASIALLLEAGDADAPRAPAGAARWYAAALRLIPDDDPPARMAALIKLAQAQQATGDLERCSTTLLEAIDLVPGDDIALRIRLTSACAACENFLGRHEPAERRLVEALKALPDKGSREAVAVLLALATGAFFTVELERMCDMARRGLAAARALGEPALIAGAAAALAHGCATAGLVAEARASADEAGARLDDLPDDTLALSLDAVSRLAWAEYLTERFDVSIRHAARGAAVARATGQGQHVSLILAAQALSTAMRGDLPAATALHEEAVEAAEVAANDYVATGVLTASANIAMATGDHERARRAARGRAGRRVRGRCRGRASRRDGPRAPRRHAARARRFRRRDRGARGVRRRVGAPSDPAHVEGGLQGGDGPRRAGRRPPRSGSRLRGVRRSCRRRARTALGDGRGPACPRPRAACMRAGGRRRRIGARRRRCGRGSRRARRGRALAPAGRHRARGRR